MPAIKPRTTQKHLVRNITRLYHENNETSFACAKFIGEPTEYVLSHVIATVLAKDKDFQSWLAENPGSHVPAPRSQSLLVPSGDCEVIRYVKPSSFAHRSISGWPCDGLVGLHRWPFPGDNVVLAAIHVRKPWLFQGFAYLYATLWFSTPFIALSIASALLYVAIMRVCATASTPRIGAPVYSGQESRAERE